MDINTGNDNALCGPPGNPCQTVEYAVEVRANDSDVVTLRAGVYVVEDDGTCDQSRSCLTVL